MADKLVDWTIPGNVWKLRHLWNVEKMPIRDIARAFGLGPEGRNAIVGKAHRLGLDRRESPISSGNNGGWSNGTRPRSDKPKKASPLCEGAKTLPVLTSNGTEPIAAVKAEPPRPAYVGRHESCQWPFGTPGKDLRFCGEAAELGRPYCPTHVDRAYVRVRARNGVTEDQAAA